jgi:2-hydroxychromene-2-carboxylate isomerase
MANSPIRYYFDYISPYGYLGWTQIHRIAERHGRTVEPVPVLLAGVLNALGTKGPAEVAPKREYLYKHLVRLAHQFGVPFQMPPTHPFNPLVSLRVTLAVADPEARGRLVSALYAAVWAGGGGAESPEQVAVIAQSVGLDPRALLAATKTGEVKERLRLNTEELLRLGGFGVPTYTADGELFFGVDSLAHLELFLRGEDPLTPEALERWRRLPSSASRS